MGYQYQVFVADEQPTPAKWQQLWDNDASFNNGSGLSAISSPIKAASANHLIFTAASGSSVKLGVLRQNQSTDVYGDNTLIQTGFLSIVGDGTPQIEKPLSFPIAYSAAPIVIAEYACALSSASPLVSFVNQLTTESTTGLHIASSSNVTVSGCSLLIHRINAGTGAAENMASTTQYAIAWIAIGRKT